MWHLYTVRERKEREKGEGEGRDRVVYTSKEGNKSREKSVQKCGTYIYSLRVFKTQCFWDYIGREARNQALPHRPAVRLRRGDITSTFNMKCREQEELDTVSFWITQGTPNQFRPHHLCPISPNHRHIGAHRHE